MASKYIAIADKKTADGEQVYKLAQAMGRGRPKEFLKKSGKYVSRRG